MTTRRRPLRAALGSLFLALAVLTLITSKGGDSRLYPADPRGAVAIYLIDNGFHSDLAFPAETLTTGDDPVAVMSRGAGAKPWIVIGWGDEKFYTEEGISASRVGDALRALFMPGNPSVVRVEGLTGAPDKVYVASASRRLLVSPAGLAAMRRRIDASMAVSAAGAVEPLSFRQPDDPDAIFDRSVEHFSVVHLCNHWAAQVLHAGGLPVTPVLDTLPAGLKLDLSLRAGA